MVNKKNWEEFRETGLLWFVNSFLHIFGWAIVFSFDQNKNISQVYPARVKFRGFDQNVNDEGYKKVTNFLNDNITDLINETQE